jgi:hypothetical protein
MGVIGVNQHLRVYVSTAAAGKVIANDGGTTDTGIGDAVAFPNGSITYLKPDGTGVATPPTTGTYQVAYRSVDGKIYLSPVVDTTKLVKAAAVKDYVAPVQQVDKLSIPATPVAGTAYTIKLRCPEYGGLLGAEDEVNFYGHYTVQSGDTNTNVATGLTASLKKATDKAPVPFVSVTSSGAIISVAGLAQPYVHAKVDGRLVRFDLSLALPESLARGKDSSGNTLAVEGNGAYHQVASAEEFYAGYNTDYRNRGADWPDNGAPVFAAAPGETYLSHTIVFNSEEAGSDPLAQRQVIVCYFQKA